MRTILHCDMNNFYASVECMKDPSLRDKPVAVCGRAEERHGIVLAKNYCAKAFGVKTGEAIWEAKSKCPSLVIVDPHYGDYMKFSAMAHDIYLEYTDRVEAFGMDESWLDLSAMGNFGDGVEMADEIRNRIKTELGLTISVGVSFNKVFAKLGSDMKKPDAVTPIGADDFKEKIWGLPASDMLGVGPKTGRILGVFGIKTIGELAGCPDVFLENKFGKCGVMMKRYANGEDHSRVMERSFTPPIKSVGNGMTFLSDLESEEEVYPMTLALSDKVASRLREAGKCACGVSFTVKCNDLAFKEWQARTKRPTQNSTDIAEAAFTLFRSNYPWVKPVRAITVRAINLVDADAPRQLSMFEDAESLRKKEVLDLTADSLRERFGWNILRSAAVLDLKKMPEIHSDVEVIPPGGTHSA